MEKELKDIIKKQLISYLSKKFIITLIVILLSSYALFNGYIEGLHWVAIVTADVISFDVTDTMSKKLDGILGGFKDG